MIFRRLKALGADWVYHFPELGFVELAPADEDPEQAPASHSVSEGAVAELKAQKRRAEVQCFRADLAEMNARAREEAMDRPPSATVRAYRQCTDAIHVAGHRSEPERDTRNRSH